MSVYSLFFGPPNPGPAVYSSLPQLEYPTATTTLLCD